MIKYDFEDYCTAISPPISLIELESCFEVIAEMFETYRGVYLFSYRSDKSKLVSVHSRKIFSDYLCWTILSFTVEHIIDSTLCLSTLWEFRALKIILHDYWVAFILKQTFNVTDFLMAKKNRNEREQERESRWIWNLRSSTYVVGKCRTILELEKVFAECKDDIAISSFMQKVEQGARGLNCHFIRIKGNHCWRVWVRGAEESLNNLRPSP